MKAHPNDSFFEKYGSLSDPNSRTSQSPFLIVRHGISVFNLAEEKFNEEFERAVGRDDPEFERKWTEAHVVDFGSINNSLIDPELADPVGFK